MNGVYRILIALVLLVAAIASYSMGIQSGVFLFIILGLVVEGHFGLACFQPKGEMRFSDMYKHFNSCNQQLGALCLT